MWARVRPLLALLRDVVAMACIVPALVADRVLPAGGSAAFRAALAALLPASVQATLWGAMLRCVYVQNRPSFRKSLNADFMMQTWEAFRAESRMVARVGARVPRARVHRVGDGSAATLRQLCERGGATVLAFGSCS